MANLLRNIRILTGKAIIKSNDNNNYIVRKILTYNPHPQFVYQFGHLNTLQNYKEELNGYTLTTKNELPLTNTNFLCNKKIDNNIIEEYIKNNSNVRYYYLKIFSKEYILIRAL